jgi:acetate kinase
MRTLHQAAGSNADAQLAIRMFCQSVRKQLGAMSVVLDGLDMIVFTGGIGAAHLGALPRRQPSRLVRRLRIDCSSRFRSAVTLG